MAISRFTERSYLKGKKERKKKSKEREMMKQRLPIEAEHVKHKARQD
jgi:hypothetical protein